jgi:hypothetical protein
MTSAKTGCTTRNNEQKLDRFSPASAFFLLYKTLQLCETSVPLFASLPFLSLILLKQYSDFLFYFLSLSI